MRVILAVFGVLFLAVVTSPQRRRPTLMESMLQIVFVDAAKNVQNEPGNRQKLLEEYDFIVVGAGSAGCAVASRLSEVEGWNVLLIEAGGTESFLMDIPITANLWQFTGINWRYKTQASKDYCLGMINGRCHWPRGKVMGGSSVLNYMIYNRGGKRDYDGWAALGNKGWSWKEVLPYFKKLEKLRIPQYEGDRTYRSTTGKVPASLIPYKTPIADAFVESGRLLGYPIIDYNSATQIGFNYLQVSMNNGSRWSSSKSYLHGIKRRNLHVKKHATVTKIIIDPISKVAKGVEFVSRQSRYYVRARKEVIVSAGAINSPQLLMLSGIGPKRHLKEKGIPVLQDSKVGYNLQDHILPGGLTYVIDTPHTVIYNRIIDNTSVLVDYLSQHEGPISLPGGCEALGFFDVDDPYNFDTIPNMELLLVTGGLSSDVTLHKNFNLLDNIYNELYKPLEQRDNVMVMPVLLAPKSKGKIVLKDNNPFHHPLIFPNYFSDPKGDDMRVIIAGIRKSNQLMSMPPFQKLGTRLLSKPLPQCKHLKFDSDEYWDCFTRYMTFTIYHPVGTCKMGPDSDPGAVVDERLRVRGIKNLRVIDASIMPLITRAHTNVPTYMIAEKGSDMIKQDWGVRT